MNISCRRGFTVVELLAVVAVLFVLTGIFLVVFGESRSCSLESFSQANLRSLSTGAGNYAEDYGDQLFMMESSERVGEILQRATGQVVGQGSEFDDLGERHELMLRMRYSHVVLLDYLTDRQPEPIAASPFDRNLIEWRGDSLGYLDEDSGLPYGDGLPSEAGYDMDPMWVEDVVKRLWAFGSSYQVVYHAWVDDDEPQYVPSAGSPHHMVRGDSDVPVGGRKMTEVKFPSRKVFMYEEFDRMSDPKGIYAAYPEGRINMAFFDGSVRQERVGDAYSAFDAEGADRVWEQRYVPLDTFPVPMGGLGELKKLDLRFRGTKGGLGGVDFE